MADNYTPSTDAAKSFASDQVAGVDYPIVKLDLGADGASAPVVGSLPVSGPLTDVQLRATAVPVSGPLTDAQIRATALSVTGTFVKAEDSAGTDGDFGVVCLGQRRDSDTTAVSTDGDYSIIKLDEAGRVKVSTYPASTPTTTVNITANAQTVGLDVSRYSNLVIYCTGTFSTVNVTFEGSLDATAANNGNWFTVQAVRSNANTIETTTGNLSAAPAYAWELSVNALKWFRVRSTAWTSGTQVWTMQPGTYATEPIPAAQVSGTQAVSGTVTANIGTGSVAAGTNAIGDVGIQVRANATGAASVINYACPATPAGGSIKGSAGRLLAISLCNTSAGVRWLKVFNATSVTMGTTSAVMDRPIPVNGTLEFSCAAGIGFATGIMFAVTSARGVTDNTTTGVALGDVAGFAVYA
jgi:hypothetical protein